MQTHPDFPDKFGFSIDECAALAPVGRTMIYEAIKEKRLVARKCGRRTLILADDFKAFLASLPVVEAA
jgi:excisionase family DNA binding protein